MSYQIVIIQGNLTRDAEVRQVGQNSVASFGVATSRRYKKQDGTTTEETEFHEIELWGNAGVHPYLKKGASVLVQGEIKTDKWQDQQGNQRERKRIRATTLQLLGGRPQESAPAPAPQQQYQQPRYQQNYTAAPQYQRPSQPRYNPAPNDDLEF